MLIYQAYCTISVVWGTKGTVMMISTNEKVCTKYCTSINYIKYWPLCRLLCQHSYALNVMLWDLSRDKNQITTRNDSVRLVKIKSHRSLFLAGLYRKSNVFHYSSPDIQYMSITACRASSHSLWIQSQERKLLSCVCNYNSVRPFCHMKCTRESNDEASSSTLHLLSHMI